MVSKKVIYFFVLFTGYSSILSMRLSEREEAEYNYRRNISTLRDIIVRNDHVALTNEIKRYSSFVKNARFDTIEKSALHVAAENNSIKCLKILLGPIDPNIVAKNGKLPLHYACSAKAIGTLVRHCNMANIDAKDGYGETPFFSLLNNISIPEQEKFHIARILFQFDIEIDAAEKWRKDTSLHRAVITKRPKMVDFLLRYGADPHVKNKQKKTAFDLSLEIADKAITLIFEKHGMLFFPLKEKKLSPFTILTHDAKKSGFKFSDVSPQGINNIAKLFAWEPQRPKHHDTSGGSSYGITFNQHGFFVINMHMQDLEMYFGEVVSQAAAYINSIMAKVCAKINLNQYQKLDDYLTCYPFLIEHECWAKRLLHHAVQKNNQSIRFLVSHGIDCNLPVCENFTNWLTLDGREDVAEYTGNQLHAAVFYNNSEAIRTFLEQNVDVKCEDPVGRNPIDFAFAMKKMEMVAVFDTWLCESLCQFLRKKDMNAFNRLRLSFPSYEFTDAQPEVIQKCAALLKEVKVNARDGKELTLLHYVLNYDRPLGRPLYTMCKIVLMAGASVDRGMIKDSENGDNTQKITVLLQEKYNIQECSICLDNLGNVIPCNNKHDDVFMCEGCYKKLPNKNCPICRAVMVANYYP